MYLIATDCSLFLYIIRHTTNKQMHILTTQIAALISTWH